MNVFVTGGAGFIGSHFVERLLKEGHHVRVYDNFSTGRDEFLQNAKSSPQFKLIQGDLLDLHHVTAAIRGTEIVFHFAANADVRFGTQNTYRDLEQNTIGTYHVLESMRIAGVRKIVFSSTGSIYGEAQVIPTPESAPFPIQTSLYGASKLASEGLITAYCEGFGFQSWIFRFVSILGERYTHGHIFDFYKQLITHPEFLEVLGDGHQKKSYLYVFDCLDAMFTALEKAQEKINIFNLGTDEFIEVNDSVQYIKEYLNLNPEVRYTGGTRGWVGDNPFIYLDTKKIRDLGWKPKINIREAVQKTIYFLQKNPQVLSRVEIQNGNPSLCLRSSSVGEKRV